jgi:hypothetical protein
LLYRRRQSAGPCWGLNGGPWLFRRPRHEARSASGLPCLRSRPSRHAPFFSALPDRVGQVAEA